MINSLEGMRRHGLGAVLPPHALGSLTAGQWSEGERLLSQLDSALLEVEAELAAARRSHRIGARDFERLNDRRQRAQAEIVRLDETLGRLQTAGTPADFAPWSASVGRLSRSIDALLREVGRAAAPGVMVGRFALVAAGTAALLGAAAVGVIWWQTRRGR